MLSDLCAVSESTEKMVINRKGKPEPLSGEKIKLRLERLMGGLEAS